MKTRTLLIVRSLAAAIIVGVVGVHADHAGAASTQNGSISTAHSAILVGASGHDSVGSLLPLPLMPSPRFQSAGVWTAKPWKRKGRACCYSTRTSGKTRQY